jgi:hypothetical protein
MTISHIVMAHWRYSSRDTGAVAFVAGRSCRVSRSVAEPDDQAVTFPEFGEAAVD